MALYYIYYIIYIILLYLNIYYNDNNLLKKKIYIYK